MINHLGGGTARPEEWFVELVRYRLDGVSTAVAKLV